MTYSLYLITCIVTGEQYVGLTKKDIEKRWKQHCYNARNGLDYQLHRCIRLWGEEYFKIKRICIANTLDDINLLEKMWIAILNTFFDGLNMTTGGENFVVTDETKIKISISNSGKKRTDMFKKDCRNRNLGKKYINGRSDETKQNISFGQRNSSKCKGNFKGVSFAKDRNKWKVTIHNLNKNINIGYFVTEIEAAIAYNQAADKYWGIGVGYRNEVKDAKNVIEEDKKEVKI